MKIKVYRDEDGYPTVLEFPPEFTSKHILTLGESLRLISEISRAIAVDQFVPDGYEKVTEGTIEIGDIMVRDDLVHVEVTRDHILCGKRIHRENTVYRRQEVL